MVRAAADVTFGKVSVVIPALNESATIASIVAFASRSAIVGEVIVVDDGSIDGTPDSAREAGAFVITSAMLGKGASMEDGARAAAYDVVIYLDGDLQGLSEDLIEKVCGPILQDSADFVKATFTRLGGRVTVLTAKPLLRTYFPELSHFAQPLSGIVAARKSLLQSLRFENDYGVDIGLLIDASQAGARLCEVDVGHLAHESQTLEALGEMATQVARSLLERAARFGRMRSSFVREVKERERLVKAGRLFALETIHQPQKIALFDMDGVLLNGRFIHELAKATGKTEELAQFLDNHSMTPRERMRKIAAVFAGVPKQVFENLAREIPLIPGAIEAVVGLRKLGYRVGIVTDSYHLVADLVRRRVFADFSFAHLMGFRRDKATGTVTLCPAMFDVACSVHDHCKVNVLKRLMEKFEISRNATLAVGDGLNDVCMLQSAGMSFAFQPKAPEVAAAADYVLQGRLDEILSYVAVAGTAELESLPPVTVVAPIAKRRNGRAGGRSVSPEKLSEEIL